ncbi:helix-turn-helix domain-containing protein [Taibaiella chishuiensis]|uniref:Helix-turn-helix protein n=1 Tax=Taibaiella chishuiensis TaxID=1434707 RepID=A0A2P8DC36_9BACT|nr:AraC family transcriptional regulator [Taibaiella chishuiensis]PSK94782.1 helix-turn-helix protein [Taibaiella chishuiensis]
MSTILSSGTYYGIERKQEEGMCFKLNITRYDPFTDIGKHYHENAYLSLLIHGVYREMNRKAEQDLLPGELIFRPAGYDHANHFAAGGGSCLNIEFKPEAIQALIEKPVLPQVMAVYPAGTFEYLYKLLYCFIQDLGDGLQDEYILNWLAAQTVQKIPARLLWLPRVKHILEEELDQPYSITGLAARVHVHPVYLARAFKEREGITPGEYRLKMRLGKAMELLFRTRESVSSIAYATGFTDAAHFIRSFRACYPTSPHRFRASLKS